MTVYTGRFAPSPTGPLHEGSLAAALASFLDARAHSGQWLIRIEDIDTPRCVPGADQAILHDLAALGMRSDQPVLWQSQRSDAYARALQQLLNARQVYPCACSRREIADSRVGGSAAPFMGKFADRPFSGTSTPAVPASGPAAPVVPASGPSAPATGELVYPGTCRAGLAPGRSARALRVRVGSQPIIWIDRRLGQRCAVLEQEVGDFVLRRADGLWAYQLAVVVDDAEQGVTDIVRGDDLIESTARQIYLQQLLGAQRPRYLHIPVVLAADGRKLSKQNGAQPLDLSQPLVTLSHAAAHLGLNISPVGNLSDWYAQAVACWRAVTG